MTLQISLDLRADAADLHTFLETLSPEDWEATTLFMDWTPWDVLAHLHFFDAVSLEAAEGHEAFAARQKELVQLMSGGKGTTQIQREALGAYGHQELLARWKTTLDALCVKLGAMNPKARLPWFGPDMGVQMFTTARYMETWAHAQEVYDLKGAPRTHTDRIRNIVAIGVRTFGWTFVNRKLEVPGPPPVVRLTAPSGEIWEYDTPDTAADTSGDAGLVEGSAVEFCQVVTQVRNVKDTSLVVRGDVANQWMAIAQCFAGAPADPPAPGYRTGA